MASKVPLGVSVQATDEDKACGSFHSQVQVMGMSLTHIPLTGHWSHGYTQLQELLGNVVQLCARKKRNAFSEELARLCYRRTEYLKSILSWVIIKYIRAMRIQ